MVTTDYTKNHQALAKKQKQKQKSGEAAFFVFWLFCLFLLIPFKHLGVQVFKCSIEHDEHQFCFFKCSDVRVFKCSIEHDEHGL